MSFLPSKPPTNSPTVSQFGMTHIFSSESYVKQETFLLVCGGPRAKARMNHVMFFLLTKTLSVAAFFSSYLLRSSLNCYMPLGWPGSITATQVIFLFSCML